LSWYYDLEELRREFGPGSAITPLRRLDIKKRSHELIADAAKLASEHIKRITKPLPEPAHVEELNLWVKF
jgi:hypothetical protein